MRSDQAKLTLKTMKYDWNTVPDRRKHACCAFGHFMLVHGGEDIEGQPINDARLLNLRRLV